VAAIMPAHGLERPSIAVLPFAHAGGDHDDAYFAEGVIEGIIHVLSGLDELLVISQGSTHAYAGRRPCARWGGTSGCAVRQLPARR
jgi:adenylate cyclase